MGNLWSGALISALFSIHPLHVESVAWIAERKDVLCAIFGFASLWAYAHYARNPGLSRYIIVSILFILGLMAKPMLITLPAIFLLLDHWPFERMKIVKRDIGGLVVEKIPFFIISTALSAITIIAPVAQKNAIGDFDRYSLSTRISNAIISYCIYLGQTFWPGNLSAIYPYTRPYTALVMACGILLVLISAAIIRYGRLRKYLITGWLWFIVTLLPVIGVVQVGSQGHADRYTYIPHIGIFILLIWGLKPFADKLKPGKKPALIIAIGILFLFLANKTREQIGYWKDGQTLLSHAVEVTGGNEIAYYNLGNVLLNSGRMDEAIVNYQKALKLNPRKRDALNNLAGIYYQKKQFDNAIPLIKKAIEIAKAAGDEAQARDLSENLKRLNQMSRSSQNEKK